MSNAARAKRPFAGAAADPSQRQITSFFAARTPSETAAAAESARHQPPLPPSIQSNLLSVGMRVRKSVPEGYKTQGPSAFKLWVDTATPSSPCAPEPRGPPPESQELLPFCGINKVGGLAPQPVLVHAIGNHGESALAVPGLSMSQETVDGDGFVPFLRKRGFADDDDNNNNNNNNEKEGGEGEGYGDGDLQRYGELSPRSRGNARLLAVPHSRIKHNAAAYMGVVGQENMHVDEDFEEAEFLVSS